MKFAAARPDADPEKAARKLIEIALSVEPLQEEQDPYRARQRAVPVPRKGSPAEYRAGLDFAGARGWLWLHERALM